MLWLSCEGQIDVWELFSGNSFLSAILRRQGLMIAVPVDLRTKKAESFSPQLLQGFWSKLKKKNPMIVVMSPTVSTQCSKRKEVIWQQYRLRSAVAEDQIFGGKQFLFGTRIRKYLVVEKGTTRSEVPLPLDPRAWQETHVDFQNFGNLLCPLELVPASRERVVPTEWQVRAVLGDCVSKGKVISIQAPQHRQYSLISDFLDLANLSIREEAALATNWIKDRPEGLKLQNQSYDVNFLPNVHFQCCLLLQGILGGDFDIFAASGESTAWVLLWKTLSRPICLRFVL